MAAVMAMAQPSQYTQGPATLLDSLISTYTLAASAQSAIAKVAPPLPSPLAPHSKISFICQETTVDP